MPKDRKPNKFYAVADERRAQKQERRHKIERKAQYKRRGRK